MGRTLYREPPIIAASYFRMGRHVAYPGDSLNSQIINMIKVIHLEIGSASVTSIDDNIVLSKVIDIDNDLYSFACGTPISTGSRYLMIRYIEYVEETNAIYVSVVSRKDGNYGASAIKIIAVFVRKSGTIQRKN